MRRLACLLAVSALAAPALGEDAPGGDPRRSARRTPIVEAVEKAAPAVVSIGTTRIVKVRYWEWDFLAPRTGQQEQHGLGSGVIVHPAGFVVTNAHVINQADKILVKLTGSREQEPDIPATLIAADLEHDLALLRLTRPGPYPHVQFGRSDDLMLGETVIAIGNPYGLGRTVTTGIISAIDRSINVRDASFKGLIQTDAAVNRGNSGGPLVNVLGEWIAVNSAIYTLSGGSDGISFAIPVDAVRSFVVRSLRSARIGGRWLGLEFGEREGGQVVVERVHQAGPAANAGIAAQQTVSGPYAKDMLRLCFDLVEGAQRGSFTLDLGGRAGGATKVTLPFEPPPTDELSWRRLGVRCAEVDEAISEQTQYGVGSGLVVLEVREGGPTDRIGIERGDLLLALGAQRLGGLEDLLGTMLDARQGETRELKFVRPRRARFGMSAENWKARIVID